MSASVFSRSTFERGPRFVAADSPPPPFAPRALSPPDTSSFGSAAYGPVSSGRPWKTQLPSGCPGQLATAQFCPINVEPEAVMEPSAWWRKKSWETPTPAKVKAKTSASAITEKVIERIRLVGISRSPLVRVQRREDEVDELDEQERRDHSSDAVNKDVAAKYRRRARGAEL